MPVTGERTSMQFKRNVWLVVHDEDDMVGAIFPDTMYAPRHVHIEFQRKHEREPWAVYMVTVSGPTWRKDRTLGSREDHLAWNKVEQSMPKWLHTTMLYEIERAEKDRTGSPAHG